MLSPLNRTLQLRVWRIIHLKGLLLAFSSIALLQTGCISTSSGSDARTSAAFKDPDPDNETESLNLCNPTGKIGADLAKCQAQNDAYFAQFEEEAKKREPWFNFPQESWLDSTQIDNKYVIQPTQESSAIKRLETAPIVELSPVEFKELAGKDLSFPGRKAYLVRGLLYAKEGGAFNVFEKNTAVYVRHEVEGAHPQAETRSAVILWLPYQPKTLYVDCQVIE